MARRMPFFGCFVGLVLAVAVNAADKNQAQALRLSDSSPRQLVSSPQLAAADTCTVIHIDSLVWLIDGWVIGDEIYKVYLDPSVSCAAPYPFTVTEIHMVIYFYGPTPLIYGADIEDVDYTIPSCPKPDTLIALTPTYESQVPEADLYDVWVPFDPPVVVNGPFFAGFYLGSGIEPSSAPAVVTDDNPVLCTSYNIWDETIGFIDLNDNEYYSFPGRLAMWAIGYEGSCCANRGDINHDGSDVVDIDDLSYMVNFMFSEGPEPPCPEEADLDDDGSQSLDISDLLYLVDYMFRGGPPPPPCP